MRVPDQGTADINSDDTCVYYTGWALATLLAGLLYTREPFSRPLTGVVNLEGA